MPRTLVTSALPYANGPLHFGHIVGAYLPADVYVRTLRQAGEEVLFVCGTDEHGVAITIGAEAAGVDYASYAGRWREEIGRTFERLGVDFDHWSGTSVCAPHTELTQEFFRRLVANGYFFERTSEQLYSPSAGRFLADRYVVGRCPNCGHEEARGDECPSCGSWLDALDLGEPRSKLDGTPLERRETRHWYLDLPKLRDDFLGEWVREHEWKPNVRKFLAGLLEDLPARAMTRDLSWGVPIPPDVDPDGGGKVLYVWFDAPIGYVSLTAEWAAERGEPEAWKDWWRSEDTRLVHFIGKDNIPFHCLIFPGMLWGQKQGYALPHAVPAMEFYNLEGRKFNTSEGWTIDLASFLERHDAEAARFHLLASAPETADADWTWEGFQTTVNAGLADTIGNLVTRVLRFCAKHWDGRIPPLDGAHAAELDTLLLSECGPIEDPSECVRQFRFRRACEVLLANAAAGNVFVDRCAPWALRKQDPDKAASVLATAAEWIGCIARWLAPFQPRTAQSIWEMVGGPGSVAAAGSPGRPEPGDWRRLPEQAQLGDVRAPYTKLEDATVAEELETLRRRLRGGA